ncbi:putative ribonuclease H-like domain-containing protein [Tanacetum coccineum]
MEAGSSTMVAAVKLPVLNPGEFELLKMRIEQYFLMTDYALWEVIVNGDSPPPKRTFDGVEQTYPPTTAEEKLARKNELKARGTLLMALLNEHQLKFNTYKCAKTLMEAIEKRFGGNKESNKTQKTLLKQQYENFNGSSSEGLDQTYDRLQKLISQLKILGETISQEDMNLKFLRSLPSEWKTHTLIWRNKPDLDILSMDDLYNNLKIYETKVKGSSSSNQNSQNVAFVSSNNSGSSNQAYGSNSANTDSMSDAIDADDLEEMDLKWQMAMLTMRSRRFLNKTRRKINANGFETIGFDKSKVECYNCHKKDHFARECRAPRENRNKEPVRRNVIVKTIEAKALVAQDGLGYDWSDQAEEGPTNFALMAYTSSGSSSSLSSDSEVSTCSKACLKSYETLKEYYDNLTKDFNKSQLNVGAYKAGLKSVKARLDMYEKNEVVFEEDIKILKLDIKLRDNALTELRKKFEKAEKERDDLKLILEKFGNLSKNLSKLLEIQVSDKFKTGVGFDSQVVDSHVFDSQENERYKISEGYHAVPPPYTGNFMPPKYDLVLADEGEYVFNWISDSEDENETETEFKSKQRKPSFAKTEFVKSNEHVKTPRESVKKVSDGVIHLPYLDIFTIHRGLPTKYALDILTPDAIRFGGCLQIAVMSSASYAVTYTFVYTDSEPGRVFWGADEEISDGGSPRVIVLGYDGLPIQPVTPPSPNYIPGPEEPQTPPVPQDEDEREPRFIQPHDPDYVPEPIYPEYIPLEDEHEFPVEEQPLPLVVLPTAESPGYVVESDPEEDLEEYEDDETEDGPVDYPMDGGKDGEDDDGDSSGDDVDDEDEDGEEKDEEDEEEEHLAPVDSAVVVPTASISLPPEAEVERLLAMPTPPPSPPISLSLPSAGERLARCTTPSSNSSPPPVPLPLLPSSGCPTQIQTLRIASTQALVDAVTAALPSPPLPPLPPSLYIA